ncbi:MAG: type IX secretion system protein PorQ [Sediminibacterium sp.]|nr:type IX secretion system protein PorQ [Sediminibacterium sp.]
MKNIVSILLIFQFLSVSILAQIGGTGTYRFLDIPMTARAAALGGSPIAVWDQDVNLMYSNPALLNKNMHQKLSANYCNYVSDMNFGYLGYAHHLSDKIGSIGGGLQFFNYGKIQGYDEFDQKTRMVQANDYMLSLNYSRPMDDSSFNIGIALKTIYSRYDEFWTIGNAVDLGVTYHTKKDLTISVVAKNIGVMYKNYSQVIASKETLPRNVQLGLSYKLPKAPLRLMVTYDQFLKWNLDYISPVDTAGKSSTFGQENKTQKDSTRWQKFQQRFGDNSDLFMRHIVLGAEILVTKNLHIRVGYNYRRQREFRLPERRGAAGLSLGFGFNIKRFGISYAFNKMALPGNSSIFSFTYRL